MSLKLFLVFFWLVMGDCLVRVSSGFSLVSVLVFSVVWFEMVLGWVWLLDCRWLFLSCVLRLKVVGLFVCLCCIIVWLFSVRLLNWLGSSWVLIWLFSVVVVRLCRLRLVLVLSWVGLGRWV